jgi:hypothetical protein
MASVEGLVAPGGGVQLSAVLAGFIAAARQRLLPQLDIERGEALRALLDVQERPALIGVDDKRRFGRAARIAAKRSMRQSASTLILRIGKLDAFTTRAARG